MLPSGKQLREGAHGSKISKTLSLNTEIQGMVSSKVCLGTGNVNYLQYIRVAMLSHADTVVFDSFGPRELVVVPRQKSTPHIKKMA